MNNRTVTIQYLSATMEMHLSMLILSIFTIGVITGYSVSFLVTLKMRRALSKARKEVRNLESIRH